jgi:hypothetical protein
MPVEIRELLIRADVSNAPEARPRTADDAAGREEIIEESVRRVLELLQKKEER